MNIDLDRRRWLKATSLAFASIPLAIVTPKAMAGTNAELRTQFQYQTMPKDNMNCSSCLEFIPGNSADDLGKCKKIPGDDEISPIGYCNLWNTL
jgi:hypothetical protein